MKQSFDLLVIGTGSAASTIATRCLGPGWSVAVVDELPFGGTCALRGCDPKKGLRQTRQQRRHFELVFIATHRQDVLRLQSHRRRADRPHPRRAPARPRCRGNDQSFRGGHAPRSDEHAPLPLQQGHLRATDRCDTDLISGVDGPTRRPRETRPLGGSPPQPRMRVEENHLPRPTRPRAG